MKAGVNVSDKKKVLVIENRKEAIKTAAMLAEDNAIILIAGKGHENYQIIGAEKTHFDDKEEIENAFNELEK